MEEPLRRDAGEMIDALVAAGTRRFRRRVQPSVPDARALPAARRCPTTTGALINDWSLPGRRDRRPEPARKPGAHRRRRGAPPVHDRADRGRRREPGDDVVSCLVRGDPELPPLDDEMLVGIVMMFISAGHNTTTSAIGNAVLRLARDARAAEQRFARVPSSCPASSRRSSGSTRPQQAMRRIATRDTELGGRRIAAGDYVWLVFGSANLDPRRPAAARPGAHAEPPRRVRARDPPVHRRAARAARGAGRARGAARAHLVVLASTAPVARPALAAARRRPATARAHSGGAGVTRSRHARALRRARALLPRAGASPATPSCCSCTAAASTPTDWREVAPALAAAGYRVTGARPARLRRERLGSRGALRRRGHARRPRRAARAPRASSRSSSSATRSARSRRASTRPGTRSGCVACVMEDGGPADHTRPSSLESPTIVFESDEHALAALGKIAAARRSRLGAGVAVPAARRRPADLAQRHRRPRALVGRGRRAADQGALALRRGDPLADPRRPRRANRRSSSVEYAERMVEREPDDPARDDPRRGPSRALRAAGRVHRRRARVPRRHCERARGAGRRVTRPGRDPRWRGGRLVVGYVGADVPRELVAAAGLAARCGSAGPGARRPLAEAILGPRVDPPVRRILAGLLEGRPPLDFLLLSHDSDSTVRLFTSLRVLARDDAAARALVRRPAPSADRDDRRLRPRPARASSSPCSSAGPGGRSTDESLRAAIARGQPHARLLGAARRAAARGSAAPVAARDALAVIGAGDGASRGRVQRPARAASRRGPHAAAGPRGASYLTGSAPRLARPLPRDRGRRLGRRRRGSRLGRGARRRARRRDRRSARRDRRALSLRLRARAPPRRRRARRARRREAEAAGADVVLSWIRTGDDALAWGLPALRRALDGARHPARRARAPRARAPSAPPSWRRSDELPGARGTQAARVLGRSASRYQREWFAGLHAARRRRRAARARRRRRPARAPAGDGHPVRRQPVVGLDLLGQAARARTTSRCCASAATPTTSSSTARSRSARRSRTTPSRRPGAACPTVSSS